MADQDMGEMFLNFNLHPDTGEYACIDIRRTVYSQGMPQPLDVLDSQFDGLQGIALQLGTYVSRHRGNHSRRSE